MMGVRILIALLLLAPRFATAQDRPIAIVGATILKGNGESIPKGTLVFREGKIQSIDAGEAGGSTPAGAVTIDGEGLFLTPGLIDAYSEYGIRGNNGDPGNLLASARNVLDGFQPEPDSLWLRSGVTTTYVSPGGRNLIGGYGAVVKLDGTVVRARAALAVSFGETVLDAFETPSTRQGMLSVLRQTFVRAQEDSLSGAAGEAIGLVLAKEIPVHALVNTPDDILTAIRFANEFDLRLVLVSAMGGHDVRSSIAAASVPVIVGPSIIGIGDGGPYEGFAHTPANAADLHASGIAIALGTFARGGRSVALEGVVAKAHGLPRDAALSALTGGAAEILDVADRLGTLEPGKDADLVLWKGEPLSTWAQAQRVFVDGITRFER